MDDLIELTHSSMLMILSITSLIILVDKRIHWDKSTAEYQIVQNINPHVDVIYTQTKNHSTHFFTIKLSNSHLYFLQKPYFLLVAISARDFVNVRYSKKHIRDDQEYFISCSAPTTHPDKPTHDTILRGTTHVSGWKFIPTPEGIFFL